jgi:hypothetical protein
MLEVMTSNNDEALSSSAILQTLNVESVAEQELSRVLDAVPLTHCVTRIILIKSCPIEGNCERNGLETSSIYRVHSFPMFNGPKLS